MQTLTFRHASSLDLGQTVSGHHFQLRILPHDDPAQAISLARVAVQPEGTRFLQRDGWGNVLLVGSCVAPHDHFGYEVAGTAVVDSARGRGTRLNQVYRFASPKTRPGPAIGALHAKAGAFDAADDMRARFERAVELRGLVYREMSYVAGTTTTETSAEEAAAQGTGVCQDYAQILVALLRMDGIPARYVGGLMIGEGATHAWAEFFDGHTWWGEDPTNDCEAGDFYIALNRGRDHADCPMERGIFRGGALQQLTTEVRVERLPQPAQQRQDARAAAGAAVAQQQEQ